MELARIGIAVIFIVIQTIDAQYNLGRGWNCYSQSGKPERCTPPFQNAAYEMPVHATNTCGMRGTREEKEYCLQTGVTRATKSCDICDALDPQKAHPPSHLTDFNNNDNVTWWQSETMLMDVQYPNSVNLTLNLGKSFEITYIRLKFRSSRPESFAIYKRTHQDGPWIPYQYYSASCDLTYGRQTREVITSDDETKAICTDEFSDISPLTEGSVAFSTLEGRPSSYAFENSLVLQEWVTATEIKIVLNRLNSFGDEVFGDPSVLKSYFYAISDFAVGGKCKCNGHASECVMSTGQGLEDRLVCRCQHHTRGADCEECEPFYNDRPWARATKENVYECQACNCNGLSNRCFFDEDMYRRTGHGGHCLDCRENTAGVNCERCKDNFYRQGEGDRCQACNCDPTGSLDTQCDTTGRCRCKPGVTGDKCDRCIPNFYDFGPSGCRPCACEVAGSLDNNPVCLASTGICTCKENVEGQNCDTCKFGYFNLDADDRYGCMSCFCYGHASVCEASRGYSKHNISSAFNSGRHGWTGVDSSGRDVAINYNAQIGNIGLSSNPGEELHFVAPDRFLGDKRFSYNQHLSFDLRIGEDGARATRYDVVLEGDGYRASVPIYSQGNPVPRTISQTFNFRLSEHSDFQWSPQLDSFSFIRMLSNLTAIKIKAHYTDGGTGFIDNVHLGSARQGGGHGGATHVEQCQCPEGYIGQFCESCAPGYHRDPPNGGPMAKCVPCNCNGHSDSCDVNTGRCICRHNTAGDNCERCASGFYGYALAGTVDDCKACPCPDQGECVELLTGEVACIDCREGYTGNRCELCSDGYYGDPEGRYGVRRPCQRCTCNDNIDPNAVGNCNSTSGECLKCIHNTGGRFCEACLPGFYGDALELPKGQCKACDCYPPGTIHHPDEEVITCRSDTGQCTCHPNVEGRKCDTCLNGYWHIDSSNGCEPCFCDLTGSHNITCDIHSGQCYCKPGITTRTCGQCLPYHFGFSETGCQACDCNPEGSLNLQCDEINGNCDCKRNVEGRQCERCMENKYNITLGCVDCPACYSLVQDRVNIHRGKISELRELIENIGRNPGKINDTDFRHRMSEVNDTVNLLVQDARRAVGSDGPIGDQLNQLRESIMKLLKEAGEIHGHLTDARQSSQNSMTDISAAENAIGEAETALRDAEKFIEMEGQDALRKAKEAQERFGQQSQRMTDIAKEAREEAERQEDEAMRIDETAKKALNTSQEALRIAQETLQKPRDTMVEINELKRDIKDAEALFNQTRSLSERALDQATTAYKDALEIYSEAKGLSKPVVNVEELLHEATNIKDESQQIKEDADRLIEQHRNLMEDVESQRQEAETMLENGMRQQQIADELLADADVARDIARDAVNKAETTLRDANNTLKTLKEFDQKVQESKADAAKALEKIPAIQDEIRAAEAKTQDANRNLAGADTDAGMARDVAQDAMATATKASDEAGDIRVKADSTKIQANELRKKADDVAADVFDAEGRLSAYESQAEDDKTKAKDALSKADQAKTKADASSTMVTDALDSVTEILLLLDNLDEIDMEELEKLENSMLEAEREINATRLDERYDRLIQAKTDHVVWIRNYSDELTKLRADVENVRVINATIPRDCFNSIKLEPTDPTG